MAALGLAFALSALWGYGQTISKNAVMMRAEGQYGRAFHALIAHSEAIESRLGHLLVSKSRRQMLAALDDVRLQAFAAQEDLNQLPITTVPLSNVTVFLGRLKNTAQDLSSKMMDPSQGGADTPAGRADTPAGGGELSEDDWRRLEDLAGQAAYTRDELTRLARLQQSGRMRWLDSERGSEMTYDGGRQHPLIKSLLRIDGGYKRIGRSGAAQRPGVDAPDGRAAAGAEPRGVAGGAEPRGLVGRMVSPSEALEKAYAFLGTNIKPGSARYVGEASGNFRTHHIEAVARAGQPLHLDLSQIGGLPHWMTAERPVKIKTLEEAQATARAGDFLRSWAGFPKMERVSYEEYFNAAVVTFAPEQDGVIMYPDLVRVKVALDDGEITGFTATDFLKNHAWEGRQLTSPRFSVEEVPKKVSPRLKITQVARAVILNDRDEEVLTYEVRGKSGEAEYKVFVNALDGTEERIEKIGQRS